jgi:hypothetical protein
MREGWSPLNMVVGDEPETPALREQCRFVVDRSVFEMEKRPRRNLISMGHLHNVPGGKRLAVFGPQLKKAVNGSLDMADRNAVGQCARLCGTDQDGDQRTRTEMSGKKALHILTSDFLG